VQFGQVDPMGSCLRTRTTCDKTIRKQAIALLLLLGLAGLLLSGCGPQERPLEWERVAQYDGGDTAPSPNEQPRLTVVAAPEQVPELEPYIYSFVLDQVSETDFSQFLVLAVFQGYHGVVNYSVEVEDVTRNENVITVDARFLEPAPGEALENIESSPYYVLRIKKTPDLRGEFIFVLIADGVEITRQSQVIPQS
jgi:hypothetical protein